MPKISVIIPVYNVEKYLPRCLDSLINQTLKDIEIICINDGSTDNSLSILKKYKNTDSRIKIISQKNVGVSQARNNGIKISKGEYIGFCDPDDWVSLDFYENLYNTVIEYNCDFAAGEIIKIKNNKCKPFLSFPSIKTAIDYLDKLELFKCPDYSYVCNKIYKTSELKKYNIKFVKGLAFEDLVFTPKALYYLKKGVTVPQSHYYYLSRKGSIIHTKKYKKDLNIAFSMCKDFLISKGIPLKNIITETKQYKIFGITFMKIKSNKNKKEIRILNTIKFTINSPNI